MKMYTMHTVKQFESSLRLLISFQENESSGLLKRFLGNTNHDARQNSSGSGIEGSVTGLQEKDEPNHE